MSNGNFVKETRKQLGLTQVEFANRLELSEIYISMLERGVSPLSAKIERRIKKLLEFGFVPDTPIHCVGESQALYDACSSRQQHEGEVEYLRRQNTELTVTNRNLSETLKNMSGAFSKGVRKN